ncbi:MAG: hypothetical protein Q8R08_03215 [bacterium]|nr:hypothetical protein [bacterium]
MNETTEGRPSVPYGVVRRLAYEERRKQSIPYLRVFFGDHGRRGYPGGGGLGLEVNGAIYRFTAGVKRYHDFHDGSGNLTPKGEFALACGVPGFLATNCDWHWVHSECNLDLPSQAIAEVAKYYLALQTETTAVPVFQARYWAKKYRQQIGANQENCTSLILNQISLVTKIAMVECQPSGAIPMLKTQLGTFETRLDGLLAHFLALSEQGVEILLATLEKAHETTEWRELAKGNISIPRWLDLTVLKKLKDEQSSEERSKS